MKNTMFRVSAKAQIAKDNLMDRLEKRSESGADTLEYVGMFIVAALIVAAVVAAVQTGIGEKIVGVITKQIEKITQLGG